LAISYDYFRRQYFTEFFGDGDKPDAETVQDF